MTVAIIELNDIGIRLSSGGKILCESPGFAVISHGEVILGEEARQQAHIHPLQTNNQFWQQLSLDPLPLDSTAIRHHADLAFTHLNEIHQRHGFDEVIFAVPGHFNNTQLSLLLGITQECAFTSAGLVDTGVAAIAPLASVGRHIHLDIQLHQTVLTQIQVDTQVERQSVEVIPGIGLLTFYDQWAKLISNTFIRHTRFDPLHNASTEQRLFNQLPQWIAQANTHTSANASHNSHSDVDLELEGNSIKLSLAEWVAQVQPLYDQISAQIKRLTPNLDNLFISDHCATLPGAMQNWPHASPLPPNAVALSCHAHRKALYCKPDAIRFTTELPTTLRAQQPESSDNSASQSLPTHLLWQYHAVPIHSGKWFINTQAPTISTQRTLHSVCAITSDHQGVHLRIPRGSDIMLNGRTASDGSLLKPGDVIACNQSGETVTLIQETEHVS